MKKKIWRAGVLTAAMAFLCVCILVMTDQPAFAEETDGPGEVHSIAFASDKHGDETAVGEAMTGMPGDVEYVSLIGDMVGSGKKKAPEFFTSPIYDEIIGLGFENVISRKDMSILWADHDANAVDDANIIFKGRDGDFSWSGPMKVGINSDGTIAYYVYGIAFYDMTQEQLAADAAKRFEVWVDTVARDKSVPLIVVCHVPLHYARGDNNGADAWNKALNYAATGKETIRDSMPYTRNVIFLHGHNHTIETGTSDGVTYSGEFFVPCGAQMHIAKPKQETLTNVEEEGNAEDPADQEVGFDSDVPEDIPCYTSTIYYTYTTAGYLKNNRSASLISFMDDVIQIDKYKSGQVTDGLYDTASLKSGVFASEFRTAGTNQIIRTQAREHNPMKVTASVKTVRYSKVRKSRQVVAPIKVTGAEGTVKYLKKSGAGNCTVNKKTGKVTVKKGTRTGTYKIRVKVQAAGNGMYKPASDVVKVTVKVK